ncbi:MAG: putative rane protein, partial [Myxococcaceae bacterium]|nr:putative rane protein [Myxococcaceae bacterium]
MSERTYDIALFGATGFTGKLVAEYLLLHAPPGVRWALAGRNRKKLEDVKRELSAQDARAASLDIVIADTGDEASLEELARKSKVVCTTVGPYMKYGRALVSACALHGAHYCDLTGEVPFMRESIDRNDGRARESGARIVHACGFDSLPSDLGVLMVHDHAKRTWNEDLAWDKMFAGETSGGFSGGTIATMFELLTAAKKDKTMRRLLGNPYALDPRDGGHRGPDGGDARGVRYDDDLRMWTGPFLMASTNTRVVRRSNALLDHAYGPSFRYSEAMSFGRGPKGFAMATAVTAGLGAFILAATVTPTRKLLERTLLPAPGEGPSKAARDKGFFVVRHVAESTGGHRINARIVGKSDPGYGETAKMLGESALCLALDEKALPARAGVLTPAT